ncbi:hypothetical protein F5884DRAFT_661509 [Xylogone sp. PMI_703]|nr:hypothetical protein F5884DRAFT_661509 [Xylogone sp. PMI_703]
MGRIASDNSNSGLSQGSDWTQYSPSSPRTPLSYGSAYQTVAYATESSMSQHSSTAQGGQSLYGLERQTPESLQWGPDTKFAERYQFVVEKGSEPYLQLLPQYQADNVTPQRVYLDDPKMGPKGPFQCQYPGHCPGTGKFKRLADLDRHYKNVHSAATETYPCDYLKCTRLSEPFTRKDHYRDHLRDFHKEDLGSYKKPKDANWPEKQREWLSERKLNPNWWRCSRCLIRVQLKDYFYQCSTCKHSCSEDRIKHREEVFGINGTTSAPSAQWQVSTMPYQQPVCMLCGGAGWITLNTGQTQNCSCQQYTYDDGTWDNTEYNNPDQSTYQ